MACKPEMQIFTYAPNQEGQKSTDDDEGTPIFRFATVIQDCFNCPKQLPKWTYYGYVGNEDMVPLYRGVQKCTCGFTMCITNMQGEVVGKVGQTSIFQFEDGQTYGVEVAKGQDPLGLVAFGIICDTLVEKQRE